MNPPYLFLMYMYAAVITMMIMAARIIRKYIRLLSPMLSVTVLSHAAVSTMSSDTGVSKL